MICHVLVFNRYRLLLMAPKGSKISISVNLLRNCFALSGDLPHISLTIELSTLRKNDGDTAKTLLIEMMSYIQCNETVEPYERLADGKIDVFFGGPPSKEQVDYALSKCVESNHSAVAAREDERVSCLLRSYRAARCGTVTWRCREPHSWFNHFPASLSILTVQMRRWRRNGHTQQAKERATTSPRVPSI